MRVLFDNVVFESRSGPNSFGLKLAQALSRRGHVIVNANEDPEIQLSFIQQVNDVAPVVQRVDGIWFNSAQDWKTANIPIKRTYDRARAIIVQSEFDRRLIEKFFGARDDVFVVRNGTDIDSILAQDPLYAPSLTNVDKVWSCASSWRPHKRLPENIRYFMEHAGSNDCLVIAGANPDKVIADPRVFYAGDLDTKTLIALYRASDYFLHLAWLDHCPNVVVDARAAGCHVICSSTGGTHEIAGENATIIQEDEWDFEPCRLYDPPAMDFSKKKPGVSLCSISIDDVAQEYERILEAAK